MRLDIKQLLALNDTTEDRLVVVREFQAPQDLVFKVVSTNEHIKQWYCPTGMEVAFIEGDVQVGATYRLGMKKIGSESPIMELTGEYTEIDPPNAIKYTQGYKMPDGSIGMQTLVEIDVEQQGEKTILVLQQSGFTDAKSRDGAMKGGWPTALEKLAQLVDTLV